MKRAHGLTLIELLIALTIVSLLVGLAAPALSAGLETVRAGQVRSALLASLMEASNRAAMTSTRAVLCPSANGQDCADSTDWTTGWLVFLDSNASREFEGGERLIRAQAALPGRVHLRSTAGRTRIVFQGNGGNAGSNVSFTLCDGRGRSQARALVMNNTGGLRDGVATTDNLDATCPP